jgi:hypothetical protein
VGKRESNRSLPAFRLERSQKHYRRRQHVGSAEMYACQTFGSRLFAAFSARLSFLTPRDELVVQTLMISFCVIMRDESTNTSSRRVLAEENQFIEALGFQRSEESF